MSLEQVHQRKEEAASREHEARERVRKRTTVRRYWAGFMREFADKRPTDLGVTTDEFTEITKQLANVFDPPELVS